MYPRNAASPQRIAIGPVVQISDGAVQTSGVSVKVMPQGSAASAGSGTIAYEEGIVHYVPTQAETNYTSFIVIAYKASCIPASATIVTSASATAGYAGLDWSAITAATTTVNLSGTTISTSQAVASVSGAVGSVTGAVGSVTGNVGGNVTGSVGSVTGNVGGNVVGSVGSVTAAVTLPSIPAGWITAAGIATGAIDADALATDAVSEIADGVWDEALSGHLSAGSTGNALNAAGSAGDPWSTPLPGAYGSGTAGKIIGDNLNATVSSRATQTSVDTVDTVVDAIKVKTDFLPSATAGSSGGLFIAGTNAATSVTTALTANITGNLSGSVGSVTGAVGSVTGNVGGNVTGSVGSVAAGGITASSIATGAIDADALAADAVTEIRDKIVERTTLRGTVDTGSTTTSIVTSAMSPATSVADQVKGRIVIFDQDTTTAALRGQATDITASSASATPTLTVTALTTAPASGDTFTIV